MKLKTRFQEGAQGGDGRLIKNALTCHYVGCITYDCVLYPTPPYHYLLPYYLLVLLLLVPATTTSTYLLPTVVPPLLLVPIVHYYYYYYYYYYCYYYPAYYSPYYYYHLLPYTHMRRQAIPVVLRDRTRVWLVLLTMLACTS